MTPPANRLRARFAACAQAKRPALVVYLTQGDPSPAETVAIVRAAADAGADVVELGVPFSDPSADGPVIQAAMERALRAGGSLPGALEAVAELRATGCDVPIVLFGYYNPIFVMGQERFAARAAEAGVDAVLTVDLPVEELDELRVPLAARGVEVVPLLAPTSTDDRLRRVGGVAPPFVYYVSITGVTGAALGAGPAADRIAQVRTATGAPVAVGFGIKTAADAAAMGRVADGVVVGSSVVSRIAAAAPGRAAADVGAFVAELRAGLSA
jgi:tryptophan synthase alpha chain